MDTIIKAFSGLFLMLLLVLVGTGIVSSSIDAGKAERFASDAAIRIGNSNYSEDVIEDCRADAEKMGYSLEVKLYSNVSDDRVDYGTLRLAYPYRIPFVGLDEKYYVEEDIL